MNRNVEIKAKVKNFEKSKAIAERISDSPGEILRQVDTFYKVSSGRLKLRNFQDGAPSQLLFYNRPDVEGPKISNYSLCTVGNPTELDSVLKAALGAVGVVKKTRYLYLCGQTRIHFDQVADLGNFMELEVCLTPDQTLEEGQRIADDLMLKLEIASEDLISGAYLDLQN